MSDRSIVKHRCHDQYRSWQNLSIGDAFAFSKPMTIIILNSYSTSFGTNLAGKMPALQKFDSKSLYFRGLKSAVSMITRENDQKI